ncbi:MAG: DNA topoisomerase IV subunit A [Bacilli bacterium]|nr:DNA topoisomerase IV subunit A [Bacilli bacterium]
MARKKTEETVEILGRIYDYTLEEIMGDRFGQYAKDIIQNRAIPDVRDGLKPVQRRILYAMFRDKNTFDKAHKKSATAVGNVMGHYHPHGDSSIYEAMVHMSQWWKQNECYIDMHGNNGSMDGDGAAAMRYTEARLSKISGELLKDIDKDTIEWAPNFDDTLYEPIVLPAKYPNLLVNGAKGISAGYATEIPPHNLGEVIDATIKRIDSPNCRLETILDIVKGPDFPTGAIVEGKKQIEECLTKGRGKVIIRSKYEIVEDKKIKQILIHEIPFEVNKANLVKKISDIIYDKKIDGMLEIRDESDREEKVRIAIDLKKDANVDNIINYLLKNTDLQISYSYNMVAIVNRRPMIVGVVEVLDAYISHQKEVITRRTKFDLEHAKARMHIVEGLIKALDILDEVIHTIRASKNKSDAISNLVDKYDFSEKQAEAIVNLQLYRLTNTDVNVLKEEHANLLKVIQILESILSDEEKLKDVMKKELKAIKSEYATPRKTEIKDEITEIKIDTDAMIPKEDCIVVVTKDGYVKRVSKRSYASSEDKTGLKEQDYIIGMYELNTIDTVLMFTDIGNYLFVPVHEIPDMKWKDLGKHISNIIKINPEENIIDCLPVVDFNTDKYITVFTKNGMIKRTLISDLKATRYTKPMPYMKLKDGDMVANISYNTGTDVFITTHNGFGLRYDINEVPILGSRASGVKGISLKNDVVASGSVINDEEYISLVTTKNTGKRVKLSEFERISRARKGIQVIRDVKTNPYYILKSFVINSKHNIGLKFKEDIEIIKLTELPIADRHSTGTSLSKHDIFDVFVEKTLVNPKAVKKEKEEPKEIEKENISLESIDQRMMTIDDFLGDLDKGIE